MKILLVEDDPSTRTLLANTLNVHHYGVEVAADGASALNFAEQFEYDLILLDVGIPEIDGISVCKRLRTQGCSTPILLLTAQDRTSDRVLGLDAGADDYMIKPFNMPELLARIRALLRRGRTTTHSIVTCGDLRLDYTANEIYYAQQLLRLTRKEYGILELLLLHPHRIFSRAAILERLWELDEAPTENAISSHIKAIRQKLRAAGATHDWIETMYGFGYRLRPLPNVPAAPPQKGSSSAEPGFSSESSEAVMLRLWERFKNTFTEQLDLLDQAILALQQGCLTAELQEEAKQTAHKLVGSLGVYGFPQGSILARQMETLLAKTNPLETPEVQNLSEWMIALRQQINREPALSKTEPETDSLGTVEDSPQPLLILLVDDDPAFTERLKLEVKLRSPYHLETASTLKIAQQFIDHTLPDLILLDLTFANPDEDGLIWLESLKQNHPSLPVLILTGRDSLLDRLAVSRLGAKQFLHKPVTPEQILQAIALSLQHLLPPPTSPPPPEAKVLIVDDDPLVLSFLSTLLSPWGLDVITLREPQQFWEVLTTTQPDLVVLDVEMPQVSGLELCQVVRQDVVWGDLPILVVTAHTDIESLKRAFAAGADDFIPKPILGPELVTRVISRIERKRSRPKLP